MRPRGYEGRYQHAIVRRGGHRRRREGTDGTAAAGDGAWFRHCCRFRAIKNGPVMCCVMAVRSRSRCEKAPPPRTSPVLSSQVTSQSRNNGKLDGLPNTSCGRVYPPAVALLLGYRRSRLPPQHIASFLAHLVYHYRPPPSYQRKDADPRPDQRRPVARARPHLNLHRFRPPIRHRDDPPHGRVHHAALLRSGVQISSGRG